MVIRKLRKLVDEEHQYLHQHFNLEYLQEQLDVGEDYLLELLKSEYKIPFFHHIKCLRVNHLKGLAMVNGDGMGLSDYAQRSGFAKVNIMLEAFKNVTGLEFDDFCKLSGKNSTSMPNDATTGNL